MQGVSKFALLLTKVSSGLPYALGGIVLLIAGILTYLFFVVRSARKRVAAASKLAPPVPTAKPPAAKPEVPGKPGAAIPSGKPGPEAAPHASGPRGQALRRSFSEALKILRTRVAGRNYRYRIPWFLTVGQAGSGKTTLLGNTGLNLPFGRPAQEAGRRPGCNWWFFDRGIVLDISGDFVLRADGATADERSWHGLLRLLQKHRPQRPIDGVVLTLSCEDLYGTPGGQEDLVSRAREKAAVLSKRLWEAQKALGMCFPVYILVTKCDQIPGFRGFFEEVPEPLRQDIFGWSSPHALDAAFTPEWVGEAFDGMMEALQQLQIEIFSEVRDVRDADRIFLFPDEFRSMEEPLRVYLNHVFKQSVYHESFLFRGIYFCGEVGQEPSPGSGPAIPEAADRPAQAAPRRSRAPRFLKNLFERKIFPEGALARPVSRTFVSRNRATLVTQALLAGALVVGSLGLWQSYRGFHEDVNNLLPVFQQISVDLKTVGEREYIPQRLFSKLAREMLEGMSQIRSSSLHSIFVPSSWQLFSHIHTDIVNAVAVAYDEIIMKSISAELQNKADQIIYREGREPSSATSPKVMSLAEVPRSVENLPSFQALKKFVDDLGELDRNILYFNGLQDAGFADMSDFSQVVRYVFHLELSREFLTHTEFFKQALAKISGRKLVLDMWTDDAKARVRDQFQAFFNSALDHNIVLLYTQEISAECDSLGRQQQAGKVNTAFLQHLLGTIQQTETALANPKLAWMSGAKFQPGPAYAEILNSVDRSSFLGPQFRAQIEGMGEMGFQELRKRLKAQVAPGTGPILAQEGGVVQMKLSPEMVKLEGSLKGLLQQEFIALKPSRQIQAAFPRGTRLMWNVDLLQQAVKLAEPYDSFLQGGLLQFPSDWQSTVKDASLNRLQANMSDLVAQARVLEPVPEGVSNLYMEDEIRLETQNFKKALKPLGAILSTFDRLGFVDPYNQLFDLVTAQASRLLGSVDDLLREEDLYDVQNLSAWDGQQPLTSILFGAQGPSQISDYLDAQRQRLQFIAEQYAAPMVTFLDNSKAFRGRGYMPLLTKWKGILSELRSSETTKVGGSVAVLENFIRSDLDGITLDTFFKEISPEDLDARSGNYFLHKRNQMVRAVYQRCLELAEEQVMSNYGQMQTFFNQQLAGKFPFGPVPVSASDTEADLASVRQFYGLFDQYGQISRAVLQRSSKFRKTGKPALDFLNRMADVQTFLQSFLTSDEKRRTPVPVIDFEAEFRVNRGFERGGNQIIDWELVVGDQHIRQTDANRRGRWRFGDPVQLKLRWARNGTSVPVADGPHARVDSTDGIVRYEYDNSWSLPALLVGHACSPEDFPNFRDPNPYTLKFDIRTRPEGGSVSPKAAPTQRARVFVRITLLSPDKKERLVLPDFPTHAPDLKPAGAVSLRSEVRDE